MNDFEHDKELQMALLNHPAIRREGIDPLWRWIAIIGWITVAILVLAMGARGETNFPQRGIAAGCMDAITGAAGTGVLAAPLPGRSF